MNVRLDAQTERRLWAFIRAVDTEIGGWGYAKLVGADLNWEHVFLVPQEVTHQEVDFETTGGDAAAVERAIEDGVLDDPAFVWVSWHSHHSMKPYWSKTDDERIAAMSTTGVRRLLSFVGCHDGSYRLRMDVFDVQAAGIRLGQVTMNELKLVCADDEFARAITKEINGNVKEINLVSSAIGARTQTPTESGDPRTLEISQAFAVKDLIDNDFTYDEASRIVDDVGAEGVDFLINSGEAFGPDDSSALGG